MLEGKSLFSMLLYYLPYFLFGKYSGGVSASANGKKDFYFLRKVIAEGSSFNSGI